MKLGPARGNWTGKMMRMGLGRGESEMNPPVATISTPAATTFPHQLSGLVRQTRKKTTTPVLSCGNAWTAVAMFG